MKISVPVNHNFYEEAPIQELNLGETFNVKKSGVKNLQQIFSSVYELKLGAEQLKQVKVFSFKSKRIFERSLQARIHRACESRTEEKDPRQEAWL